MASGTINGSTNNQYIASRIVWSSTATSDSNSSKVTASLQYKRTNTGYETYGTGSFSITINGTKTSVSKSVKITESEWITAVSATVTVNHNADGTKSITISSSGSISGTSMTATYCGGGATLDTIPRASSISSASNVTIGNNCNIKWTPNSASFRYRLRFSIGSWSFSTGVIHPNTTSTYTYTAYTIPLEVINQITSAKTSTMTATLYTYSNSAATTQVGSESSKTFTVTVPLIAGTAPSAVMSLSPVSSLGSAFASVYVQGRSKVKADFTGSIAKYGAIITSYSMSVNGKAYSSPYQSDYLSQSGGISVKGTVTDSRGYSVSVTENITVLPYTKPSVVNYTGEKTIICKRCESDGMLSSSGAYLRIKAGREYSTVTSGGVQKNFCVLRYRYKVEGDRNFSSWVTLLTMDNTTTNEVDVILGNVVPSTTTSYIVQIGVVDDIGEESYVEFPVPTDEVTFHLINGGMGAAFGKYAENKKVLDIADDWDVWGRVYSLGKGKADILQGEDLNNYKEFGVYNITGHSIAESLLNCPSKEAGTLIVASANGTGRNNGAWAYILQKYISYDGHHEFYRRIYTEATENEWRYDAWKARSDTPWTALGLSGNVTASTGDYGRHTNGNCYYKVVNENHVYVAFNCAFTYSGGGIIVNANAIPEKYRPARSVFSVCATWGNGLAIVAVTSGGLIYINGAYNPTNPTASFSSSWIDGYIDYWV